jgi:hypothetical protein
MFYLVFLSFFLSFFLHWFPYFYSLLISFYWALIFSFLFIFPLLAFCCKMLHKYFTFIWHEIYTVLQRDERTTWQAAQKWHTEWTDQQIYLLIIQRNLIIPSIGSGILQCFFILFVCVCVWVCVCGWVCGCVRAVHHFERTSCALFIWGSFALFKG